MRLCVFEDPQVVFLDPLVATRPVFELLCGQTTLAAKQCRYFATAEHGVLVRPLLAALYRSQHPGVPVNDFAWLRGAPIILVNGRWLPPLGTLTDTQPHVALIGDEVAYAVLGASQWRDCLPESMHACLDNWKETLPQRAAAGALICYPWDLVERNPTQLKRDFAVMERSQAARDLPGVAVSGPREHLWVAESARIEPMTLIDTNPGPVVIGADVVVSAFSRIEGPCFIGAGTQVNRASIRGGCTFGPQCRLGGEIEASILQGYTNKYHDGFLGHAYLGEWVNFGAGTHNSDLRNDYGEVSVPLLGSSVKTGLAKVGCFIGDHSKTGLGTLINTGSSIGAFTGLLSDGSLTPRYVPPFSMWSKGVLQESGNLAQLFATAAKVMARRGCTLTEAHIKLYQQLFDDSAFLRMRAFQDAERRRAQSA